MVKREWQVSNTHNMSYWASYFDINLKNKKSTVRVWFNSSEINLQYLQGSSNGTFSNIYFDLFVQWYVFDIQYARVNMVTKKFILVVP